MMVKMLPQRSQLGIVLPSSDAEIANLNEFSERDITDGPSLRMCLDMGNSTPSRNSVDVLCDLPDCGIAFNSSNVQQHLGRYHANLERIDGKIICPIDRQRVTDANYGWHILNVHFKHLKGWCNMCKKEFSRKDNLNRHMKTHMGRE
ncbi:hypothetical protein IW261DRAFT_1564082 [Armillaria novae-zelandiae]|uniref:C2H2-type domain-containing protein n=1 Tax=Armillaria novae-zelandiae TaxID=153914 RepID=A0AA39PA09_9AGAR|nr:hypothetical protein IW261DRAFT_1564082 [Armillaria novae-zelandiae]